MTKKDLVNGSVVELRNGKILLYVDETLFCLDNLGEFCHIQDYNDDLTDRIDSFFDIMKVHNKPYNSVGAINMSLREIVRDSIWLWERPNNLKLSDKAIAVLKALPRKYTYIAKNDDDDRDNLHVFIDHPHLITSADENDNDCEYWQYWHLPGMCYGVESLSLFSYLFKDLDPNICYKISDLIRGDEDE